MRPNASVTIRRPTPGGTDPYGNPIEGEIVVVGEVDGMFAPRAARSVGTSETVDLDRDGIVLRPAVFLPPGADVRRGDLVDVNNYEYRVVGLPDVWLEPGMTERGVEVQLERSEG